MILRLRSHFLIFSLLLLPSLSLCEEGAESAEEEKVAVVDGKDPPKPESASQVKRADIIDQIALESDGSNGHILPPPHGHGGGHPLTIPMPLPIPVKPGGVILPQLPQPGDVHGRVIHAGGPVGHGKGGHGHGGHGHGGHGKNGGGAHIVTVGHGGPIHGHGVALGGGPIGGKPFRGGPGGKRPGFGPPRGGGGFRGPHRRPNVNFNVHAPPPPPQHKVVHQVVAAPQQNYIGPVSNHLNLESAETRFNPAPAALAPEDPWPLAQPDMPKIVSLDVKCEKNMMKVSIQFDRPFDGIIFSKGHFSNRNCIHVPAGRGLTSAHFDISINSCGTSGNSQTGLYGYGSQAGSGTYFENIIVIQYDKQVQEVWDQAHKLRCTWHDQYEKAVTFRPFRVQMLDVVRADFAGDNVGCWMQIQVGKGPWASEVSGVVKIGQTMTMVLAIKDDDNKFDMLVRNCMAHDGKRPPIQLVDQRGCVTRPKLMSRFTKIKNFGATASVLSYAHFQAFKFPDSIEVHFLCTIQICRHQCPEQCSQGGGGHIGLQQQPVSIQGYEPPRRAKRDTSGNDDEPAEKSDDEKNIDLNRIINVVSTGDLAFALEGLDNSTTTVVVPVSAEFDGLICMSTPGFAATLIVLLAILVVSCLLSAFLCIRYRAFHDPSVGLIAAFINPSKKSAF